MRENMSDFSLAEIEKLLNDKAALHQEVARLKTALREIISLVEQMSVDREGYHVVVRARAVLQ
jgi:hypothetical protein